MGSVGVAAWIAKITFIGLLVHGSLSGEVAARTLVLFAALGVAAWIGLPCLPRGADFVIPVLAVIDIALVFAVFKGDVRIT